jgi:hypothetical protein
MPAESVSFWMRDETWPNRACGVAPTAEGDRPERREAMSDTHAHTAQVQADVQTGKPHFPPGHVEAERPVERLDDRQIKPIAPYLTAGAIALVLVVTILFLMA